MLQQYRRVSGLWKWATGVNDPNPPIDIDSVGGGNAAVTERPDTAVASGTIAIAGVASVTEAAQTLTAAGTHPVTGSSTTTEAAQTLTGAGTVGTLTSTGTATITEAPQTLTGAGAVAIAASSSKSEAPQTLTGSATHPVTGSETVTEAAQTVTALGTHPVTGSSTVTEAAQTLTGSGTVAGGGRTGTATITEAADRVTATGTVADLIGVIDNGDWRPRSRSDVRTLLEEIAEPARVVGAARIAEQADRLVASGTVSIGGDVEGGTVGDQLAADGRVTGLSYRDSDNQFWLLAA